MERDAPDGAKHRASCFAAAALRADRSRRPWRRPLAPLLGLLGLGCAGEDAPSSFPDAAELHDPERCRGCHSEHYAEWSASMHAYSARDPVFLAMNRRGQEETRGALGSLCVNCHAPMAVATGASLDGLDLDSVPAALQGVTCYFCHNAEATTADHNNPLQLSGDVTMRGRVENPTENPVHRSSYSALFDGAAPESAALCGSCHDIVLPSPPAPETAEPIRLEATYLEWQNSIFAPDHSPTPSAFSSCNSCHMPVVDARGIANGGPPRARHSHHFAGVDVPLDPFPDYGDAAGNAELAAAQAAERERVLDPTLLVEICLQTFDSESSAIHVTLDNAAAGHHFPSGAAQDRRAFVEIVAYQGEEVLYQSGVVADGEDVTELDDPDLWLFRDETFDENGEETHMFWNVAEVVEHRVQAPVTADRSDPRYYISHAIRRFPRAPGSFVPGVPDRISVRLRVTPIGLDVLSDLVDSGHLDPGIPAAMPTLDLLPHRRLAVAADSPLAGLRAVSMEYSAATLASPLFLARQDFTETPPRSCVGMPRR